MPTVPRYNATITQNVSQTQQRLSASPDAFGASSAQALGNVGQGLNMIAQRREEMRLEDAETSAREAAVAASDALRELQRGENGYLTQSGRNAIDGFESYQDGVDEVYQRYAQGLRDPDARQMFDRLYQQQRESALNSGVTHYANQRRAYRTQVAEAELGEARLRVTENRGDAEARNKALEDGEQAIRDIARMNGSAPEAVELAIREFRGNSAMNMITAAVDSRDSAGAQALLEAYGDDLTSTQSADASELIRNMNITERSQRASDFVFERFGTNLRAGRAYIRENFTGEMRDEVLRRFERRSSEVELDATRMRESQFDEAVELALSGTSSDDMPESLQAGLTEDERAFLDTIQMRGLSDVPPNGQLYNEVLNMDVGQLARVDLRALRTQVSREQYRDLAPLVQAARENPAAAIDSPEFTDVRTANQQLEDTLELAFGQPRRDWSDTETMQANLFTRRFQELVNEYERVELDGQRKATGDERQAILDRLMVRQNRSEPRNILGGTRETPVIAGLQGYGAIVGGYPQEVAMAAYDVYGGAEVFDQARTGEVIDEAMEALREQGVINPTRAQVADRMRAIIRRREAEGR